MNIPSAYSFILFIHVLAGAFLLGGATLVPATRRAIRRARTAGQLRSALAFAQAATHANPIFAVTLLGTGVYLGSNGVWWSAWFWVALVLWLANSILAVGVVERSVRKMAGHVASLPSDHAVPATADRLRWSPRLEHAQNAVVANDFVALFLMLARPDLATALAAFGITHLASLAIRALLSALRIGDARPATSRALQG